MKRFICTAALIAGAWLACTGLANAQHSHRHWHVVHAEAAPTPKQMVVPHHVNYHDVRWNPHRPPTPREFQLRHYQQLYPKFYYGFHGSYLYRAGMPSGDIGIRGMPW